MDSGARDSGYNRRDVARTGQHLTRFKEARCYARIELSVHSPPLAWHHSLSRARCAEPKVIRGRCAVISAIASVKDDDLPLALSQAASATALREYPRAQQMRVGR